MRKPEIKCAVKHNIKFCTVSTSSGSVMTLKAPLGMTPINIDLFTAQDCSYCKEAERKIRDTTKGIKDIVKINLIDVESDAFMKSGDHGFRVDTLPTIKIGGNLIVGDFDDDQIWRHILNTQ